MGPGVTYRGPAVTDPYHDNDNPYVNCNADPRSYKIFCTSKPCGLDGGNSNSGTPGSSVIYGMLTLGGYHQTGGAAFQGSSFILESDRGNPHPAVTPPSTGWTKTGVTPATRGFI